MGGCDITCVRRGGGGKKHQRNAEKIFLWICHAVMSFEPLITSFAKLLQTSPIDDAASVERKIYIFCFVVLLNAINSEPFFLFRFFFFALKLE
jgi:hypothetical protein